jgi:asparagine synthase (glutamine-hydrolysing)
MCGFAGVIAWDERYRVSHETLAKMSAAIAHRGPDGEGFHFNHHEQITPNRPQVALAFRRLAILDPDPRSMQPFTDGRHWLVFNGEIYNFRELKKELSLLRPDYVWKTTGDTEVLLCAYAVWREECVEHLNGMFAFAVWDEVEKSLFLARDRMGQKPLFIAPNWPIYPALAFASEVAPLQQLSKLVGSVDVGGISQYLRAGYTVGVRTAFVGVLEFRPATIELYKSSFGCLGDQWTPMSGETYFDREAKRGPAWTSSPFSGRPEGTPLCATEQSPSEATARQLPRRDRSQATLAVTAVQATRYGVIQAVERQLVADVPLGVLLSGGIDSSVIASAARRFGPVQTFSIAFDDPAYDESQHAAAVARHLGTQHHVFRVTPHVVDDLPKLAAVFGVPFGDSSALPMHYLSRETRTHVKVALSGDGGDELFGGYDRYRAMELGQRWSNLPVGPLIRFAKTFEGGNPKSMLARVGRFVTTLRSPEPERYASYVRLFSDDLLNALWPTRQGPDQPDPVVEAFGRLRENRDGVQTALAVDRITYLPGDLLTKVDRCSMLHGLEVRSPFMDHELVQFAAGLTTDQLLKGGPKRMLREAFKDDLPAWVFKRKKMGFAVPIGDWFRGPLRAMLRDTLFSSHAFGRAHFDMKVVERLVDEHETKKVDHSQRLYALLMLELWWNTARQ